MPDAYDETSPPRRLDGWFPISSLTSSALAAFLRGWFPLEVASVLVRRVLPSAVALALGLRTSSPVLRFDTNFWAILSSSRGLFRIRHSGFFTKVSVPPFLLVSSLTIVYYLCRTAPFRS
ncbi:hypothetical protein C8R46DRAFT_380993 [Mycena filopes]|nr:hypothetical protein C8R46DRAFT_380993 [Mycena filopes]